MVSEYRFLRFEIVGLATIFLYVVILVPVAYFSIRATLRDLGASLAIISSLFLVSLPLGYWEHQLVVNAYRSDEENRMAHQILGKMAQDVLSTQSNQSEQPNILKSFNSTKLSALLTAVTELCIYSIGAKTEPDVFDRLGDRWSHFYARKAVSIYAPIIASIMWAATLLFGLMMNLRFQYSNAYASVILIVLLSGLNYYFIHRYSEKIWFEINYLEAGIVLLNEENVKLIIASVLKQFAKEKKNS